VGFDLALVLGLAATGWYVWRARTRAELPATITATLLVVDGWFDIMTSHGNDEVYGAIAASLLLELPLAAVCLWIALHAESVRTYRTHLLAERAEHRLAGGPAGHHHPHDPPR
jgi:hypothetical protein